VCSIKGGGVGTNGGGAMARAGGVTGRLITVASPSFLLASNNNANPVIGNISGFILSMIFIFLVFIVLIILNSA